ncbi:MAG: hypothetical protein HY908_16940 [Myxococcales bacterium]|nr:hypothetical protein [Myxococcales bacterium]
MTFNTAPIVIDPGAFAGSWYLDYVSNQLLGKQTVKVVPGLSYALRANNTYGTFAVAAPCAISPPALAVGTATFSVSCGPLDTVVPTVAFAALPSYTNADVLEVAGSVQDAAGIASVTLSINGAAFSLVPGADGMVHGSVALIEGSNTLILRATDLAGNSAAVSGEVVLDTIAPLVELLSPEDGQALAQSTFPVTVRVTDSSPSVVTVDGRAFELPPGGGVIATTVAVAEEGPAVIEVDAVDAATNAAHASAQVLLDFSAPLVSADLPSEPWLAELPDDLLLVTLHIDDLSATSVTCSFGCAAELPRGGGVLQLAVPLSLGDNAFGITVTNEVGLASALSVAFVYDTTPPSAAIVGPEAGQTVRGGVDLVVEAADALTGVASVAFRVDGGAPLPGELTGTAWTASLDTASLADGAHVLEVTVTDLVGNQTALPQAFAVDNTAPVVAIASPVAGAYVGGVVRITASASDTTSGVAAIGIAVNGEVVASCQGAASCSVDFDTGLLGVDGAVQLSATAVDAAGNEATPAPIEVVVDNAAPRGFLTSPVDGAVVRGSLTVAVAIEDPSFASVECFVDGVSLGVSTNPTFNRVVDLSGTPSGPVLVLCAVTDLASNVGTEVAHVTLDAWTEEVSPRTLNLRSAGGANSVTFTVEGPNVGLLLAAGAPPLALLVPGGTPVYATAHLGSAQVGDADRDGVPDLTLKFDRQALIAAIRAGIGTGAIDPAVPVQVSLYAGARPVGADSLRVQR